MAKNDQARPGKRNLLRARQITEVDWEDLELLRMFISDRARSAPVR
jgi:ribosomal protein S18